MKFKCHKHRALDHGSMISHDSIPQGQFSRPGQNDVELTYLVLRIECPKLQVSRNDVDRRGQNQNGDIFSAAVAAESCSGQCSLVYTWTRRCVC